MSARAERAAGRAGAYYFADHNSPGRDGLEVSPPPPQTVDVPIYAISLSELAYNCK